MRVVAGCDGGGTKCEVHVEMLDEHNHVVATARASSGPANVRSDPEQAAKSITEATANAVAGLGLSPLPMIDMFVAGLAGAGLPEIRSQWAVRLESTLPVRSAQVVADAAILLAAAGFHQQALATVVGTGSIAWARCPDGSLDRAGGLGPEIGDEGSAFWIGMQAMHLAISATAPSEFTASVLEAADSQLNAVVNQTWHRERDPARRRKEILARFGTKPIAAISPFVFAHADSDPDAKHITDSAAHHIGNLIVQAASQLCSSVSDPIPWVCAGGVAVHQPEWLADIRLRVRGQGIYLAQPVLVKHPVQGAIALARAQLQT